jgi:WS/DGAT/MGAT family acyltransferase
VRSADVAEVAHAEHPGIGALALAALQHDAAQYLGVVRHSADIVRSLAGVAADWVAGTFGKGGVDGSVFAPRTALNVPITGDRGYAAASIPLDALKRIAAAHDAKLNDVVLAICSGVLRRWLERHGGIPEEPLIAWMPISLRAAGNEAYTTQATMILVNLATHLADPVERLRAIRESAGAAKALAQRARDVLPTDFPTIGVAWIMQAGAWLYGRLDLADTVAPIGNLVISNVAGPQGPLYLAGTRMRTYWPMSIVEHGLGLNITVLSYDGAMGFGFTTARHAVPDARELTRALGDSLDALGHTAARHRPAVAGEHR